MRPANLRSQCPRAGDTRLPAMIPIATGTFAMGDADGDEMDRPRHNVTVSAFEIDATEVTSKDYRDCVNAEKCAPPARSDLRGATGARASD